MATSSPVVPESVTVPGETIVEAVAQLLRIHDHIVAENDHADTGASMCADTTAVDLFEAAFGSAHPAPVETHPEGCLCEICDSSETVPLFKVAEKRAEDDPLETAQLRTSDEERLSDLERRLYRIADALSRGAGEDGSGA